MFYQLMFAYLSQGLVNKFRRQPQNKPKLYCENKTFEDECSYVEEIDRRVSNLVEDALSENYVHSSRELTGEGGFCPQRL